MTKEQLEITETSTPEERFEAVLSYTFKGMHRVGNIKKTPGEHPMWETCCYSIATWDFDQLTRLVLAAHHYCVRVELENGGPRRVKIILHARKREGSIYERHPTIQQAIENFKP